MNLNDRLDRLDRYIAEGRLLRGAWQRTDEDGRHLACLLAALSPEAGEAGDAGACPAEVMPPWLAHITPYLDDYVSEEAWSGVIRRYAALARRWHVLTDEDWWRADYAARAIAVREARRHTDDERVLTAIEAVLALLDRVVGGGSVTAAEWASAEAPAWVTRAPAGATRAAWAAEAAANGATAYAAEAAASTAYAAEAAASTAYAAEAAASTAEAAAWDRITTAILDDLEARITAGEAA